MNNEILLALSIIVIYGSVLLMYRYFGRTGLFCWTAIATILANIEVLRVVEAFGVEQTLGNVLFASTFLVTDILSEKDGARVAKQAVTLGIVTSLIFIVISQSWLLYSPSESDWAGESFEIIFSNTPRLIFASLIVYAICQRLDVWLYHRWWALTTKLCGDSKRFLWVRNNFSTLISQAINTVLYNLGAFWGIYDTKTLISICIGGYLIFIVTSIADTPVVYMARKISPKEYAQEKGR
ncbi:MAG: queuosine precursor transporter [Clostridiales bacterium]|nr:queuosine precursor transporter [Clostridiales bacterium]